MHHTQKYWMKYIFSANPSVAHINNPAVINSPTTVIANEPWGGFPKTSAQLLKNWWNLKVIEAALHLIYDVTNE